MNEAPAPSPPRGLQRIPVWVRIVLVVVLVVGIGPLISFWHGVQQGVSGAVNGRMDGAGVAQEIQRQLEERTTSTVTVTCPDMVIKRGTIGDCSEQSPGEPAYLVRVTQDDDQGHYTWQVTDQAAP